MMTVFMSNHFCTYGISEPLECFIYHGWEHKGFTFFNGLN